MVAVMVVVVGALYLGSDILIPLALAILLSFMLAPIVIRLRRLGLGRIPSVLAVVLLLFVALLGLGSIVASQVVHLAENLPTLRMEPARQDPRPAHRRAERRRGRAHHGHAARSRARSWKRRPTPARGRGHRARAGRGSR